MTSRSTVPISVCFVCLIMSHFRQESPLDEEFDEIMRESDISQSVSEAKVLAIVNKIHHSIADKIVVLCKIPRSLMEARDELFKYIAEMLEKYWIVGERWRIDFYWFIIRKLEVSQSICKLVTNTA